MENKSVTGNWNVPQHSCREGTGNWDAYDGGMEPIYAAAKKWKNTVRGIDKLWLCWNIDNDWCLIQQKMILDLGWTPVIGWDPNCAPSERTVLPGAIEIDFNSDFGFATMWPHFPLEFAYLWADRLAFWHADLLVRKEKLRKLVGVFESLQDGEMAAVKSIGGLRKLFRFREHRYWELIGCTTKAASQHQFETGSGWWRHFYRHPNTPSDELLERERYYYDSGVGIMYWKRNLKGKIYNIKQKFVQEGHSSEIGSKNYKKGSNKSEELKENFDIQKVVEKLELQEYFY